MQPCRPVVGAVTSGRSYVGLLVQNPPMPGWPVGFDRLVRGVDRSGVWPNGSSTRLSGHTEIEAMPGAAELVTDVGICTPMINLARARPAECTLDACPAV